MTDRAPGHPRLAVGSATLAVVVLAGGWRYAVSHQPGSISWDRLPVSALVPRDTPHRAVLAGALVVTGIALLLTAYALPALARPGRILLGAGGALTAALALVAAPSTDETSVAFLAVASGALGAWPCGRVGSGAIRGRTGWPPPC